MTGTTAVTHFEVWLYASGGIFAICYLLWVRLQSDRARASNSID